MLKVSLYVLLAVTGALSTPLDDLFDEALWEAGQNMIKKGLDKIDLPHFDKQFSEHIIGPININGDVFVHNGVFKNLSSIYRIGSIGYQNLTDGTIVVTASLGMKEVELMYEFGYKVMFFSSHKTINAQCTENEITVEVALTYDDQHNCQVKLNKASVDKLGGFVIDITPKGVISNLEGRLLTSGLNRLADISRSFINQNLLSVLSKAMQSVDVCSMLPF
ncbi:hypothetical protein AAG570_002415 [Ranatra chinensis]|uniref:Uncharacterized protein n=1 Tax=Ranatra chinensis TaxID=642074 RepID=A0ABD0Y7G9_9HEMI